MYYVCHITLRESPWHRMLLISKNYLVSKSNMAKKKKENYRSPHFNCINATWKTQFCRAELNDAKWLS